MNKTVVVDFSKQEPSFKWEEFSMLKNWLKNERFELCGNQHLIEKQIFLDADIFVLINPRKKFTLGEIKEMREFLGNGGMVLILLNHEAGEKELKTNINYLLEEHGMIVNNDSVIQTHYLGKYLHPKEVVVSDGVLNKAINEAAGKSPLNYSFSFLYPYGSTLIVVKPAVAILSTGTIACPLKRPVCAIHENPSSNGKLVVVGSALIFSNSYIRCEENVTLLSILFKQIMASSITLNKVDADNPEIDDYEVMSPFQEFVDLPFGCLTDNNEILDDLTTLYSNRLYSFDTKQLPEVIEAYTTTNTSRKLPSVLSPKLICPLPRPLLPSVLPPSFCRLPNPPLELFDLVNEFTPTMLKIGELANICCDQNLDYYIQECGDLLHISNQLPKNLRNSKNILAYLMVYIFEGKKQKEIKRIMKKQSNI